MALLYSCIHSNNKSSLSTRNINLNYYLRKKKSKYILWNYLLFKDLKVKYFIKSYIYILVLKLNILILPLIFIIFF